MKEIKLILHSLTLQQLKQRVINRWLFFAALCTAGDFIFTLLLLILDRSGDLNLIKSDTDIAIVRGSYFFTRINLYWLPMPGSVLLDV